MKSKILLNLIVSYSLILFANLKLKNMINEIEELNEEIKSFDYLFPLNYLVPFAHKYIEMPTIFIITPTYNRNTQLADLTRLKNTLLLVPKILWIIIEDSDKKTEKISKFLKESCVNHVHLNVKTNSKKQLATHKGVIQRNEGLNWLRRNELKNGVVYFADDDNSYDLRLFEEIRYTKKISAFPIGLVGGVYYEKPICLRDKVIGWFFYFNKRRQYPIDMASFAINVNLIHEFKNAIFTNNTKKELEGSLLKDMTIKLDDFEAKADNCTKFYVWHTKTKLIKPERLKNEILENDMINEI